ncbi:type I-E CRISPR-associated protein Cas6/Cse3/CasE [Afifella sp. H1R]|uniref:type I-E CRISPR-associated protein Cas6/Cse3/CasE n=1 Tax=Afifella sp. H1R TaxID=2908841 RepID=UPI001F362D48|nr:type I-E CRISPR-associated protein Cas6/Cse3/CasE [Afifella sp. H1R]MCF1506014.1 type I-E CRISPR-associated protein Cas6/Cse3/CasE [Afifella sp. H1R]
MTDPLFFTRLTLKRDADSVAPLLSVLQPEENAKRLSVEHKLLWTVMPESTRRAGSGNSAVFLWRRLDSQGCFYLLGPEPTEDSPFFRIESKPFAPAFTTGQRLAFDLRLNATVDRKTGTGANGKALRKRCDVAMDLMQREEREGRMRRGDRAMRREALAQEAAAEWLSSRAEAAGFALEALTLGGYRAERIDRGKGRPGTIGVFDLKGLVSITDPAAFLDRLTTGFGRAKAFGCGLMLVRPAP